MSANSGPGWKKYPKHRITTKPAGVRVQIEFEGELIADTRDAIRLEETHVGHVVAPVVYYIPRKDVKMERLVRTSHETSCPFKDEAGADCETPMTETSPQNVNLCALHCTWDLQVAGVAVALLRSPADLPILTVALPHAVPAPRTGLHAPPLGAPPHRILLHSFLI